MVLVKTNTKCFYNHSNHHAGKKLDVPEEDAQRYNFFDVVETKKTPVQKDKAKGVKQKAEK